MIRSGLPTSRRWWRWSEGPRDARHAPPLVRTGGPVTVKFFPGLRGLHRAGHQATRSLLANTSSVTDCWSSSSRSTRTACSPVPRCRSRGRRQVEITGPSACSTLRDGARAPGWCSRWRGPGWRRSCRCCRRWPTRHRPEGDLYYAPAAGGPVLERSWAPSRTRSQLHVLHALSERTMRRWDGEVGLITDVLRRRKPASPARTLCVRPPPDGGAAWNCARARRCGQADLRTTSHHHR